MFNAVSVLSALAACRGPAAAEVRNVDLPVGDRCSKGQPDVANNNCPARAPAGMVLFQPALSQACGAEVEKMRTAYKAPIDPGMSTQSLRISFPSGVRKRLLRGE
jgi:hypothetical protein